MVEQAAQLHAAINRNQGINFPWPKSFREAKHFAPQDSDTGLENYTAVSY